MSQASSGLPDAHIVAAASLASRMSDSNSDLLLGDGTTEEEVPEDLERGLSGAPGHDFRTLIEAQPDAVIRC